MAKRFGRVNLAQRRNERLVGRMGEKDKAREERLAAALRENLRRRKAQARDSTAQPKKDPSQPASE